MNKQTEALKMAIEALEDLEPDWECPHGYHHNQCPHNSCDCIENKYWEAIQACKEALEQPACKHGVDDGCCKECYIEQTQPAQTEYVVNGGGTGTELHKPAQEPVAFNCKNCHACLKGVVDERGLPVTLTRMIVCPDCGNKRCPKASDHRHFCTNSNDTDQAGSIYRTHPAPSWQGLSDDEIEYAVIIGNCFPENWDELLNFARAIEQALKEKNGYQ